MWAPLPQPLSSQLWGGVSPAASRSAFLLIVFLPHPQAPSSSRLLFSLETNMCPDKIRLLCLCGAWEGWGWGTQGSPGHLFPLVYTPGKDQDNSLTGPGGWRGREVVFCGAC